MFRHLTLALCLAAPTVGFAQEAEPYELRNTNGWFLTGEVVTSVALGFFLPDLVSGPRIEARTCANSWCGTNGFDLALGRAFLAPNPRAAATASHIFTIGLTPAVGLAGVIVPAALAGRGGYAAQDSVIVINSFLIATGLNSIGKERGGRQRPAFYFDREDVTEVAHHEGEEFLSFYSGDTTWAFALASSASTLAFLRGYSSAKYIALGTGVLALTGGILRMSADMHWATDVLVGAAAGSAIGIGLPLLLHGRKKDSDLALVPSVGVDRAGLTLTGSW